MPNVVVELLAVVALTHHLHLAASGRHALPSTVLELAVPSVFMVTEC
mgnify:CR=1 FL=1